jgi:hypothetical protein
MHRLYLAVAFSGRSPGLIWMILMITFGLSGVALLIFAKPFASMSSRYPEWTRSGSHSARFYRVMGTVWVTIAAVMAVPVVVILAHS